VIEQEDKGDHVASGEIVEQKKVKAVRPMTNRHVNEEKQGPITTS